MGPVHDTIVENNWHNQVGPTARSCFPGSPSDLIIMGGRGITVRFNHHAAAAGSDVLFVCK